MSMQSSCCDTCNLDAIVDDADEQVLSVLQEDRDLHSIVRELVTLRRTHNCQVERDLEICRQQNSSLVEANHRLQDAVRALERDSKHLKEEWEEEKARLGNELGTERQKVLSLAQMLLLTESSEVEGLVNRAPFPRKELHNIALRCVFDYLALPPGILDYSLLYGPHSGWLRMIRTLKSVALVCKSWHAAVLPLLYRNVVLRRVGQIAAFARTIRSAPRTIAPYVRSLTLCSGTPFLGIDYLSGPFPAAKILLPEGPSASTSLLQRLSRLSVFDAALYSPELGDHAAFLPGGTYANLTSLSIFVSREVDPPWWSSVQFPNLETLVLSVHHAGRYRFYHLPKCWGLPKLKALRFRLGGSQPKGSSVLDLCRKYGSTLSNLDFSGSAGSVNLLPQMDAAAFCPHLDHLVLEVIETRYLREIRALEDLKNFAAFSQQIRLVDIVFVQEVPSEMRLSDHIDRSECAWTTVRYLDGHVVAQIPDLPYLFPGPNVHVGDGSRVMDFHGVKIKETNDWLEFDEGWEQIGIYPLSDTSTEDEDEDERDTDKDSDEGENDYTRWRYGEYKPGPCKRSIGYTTDEGETEDEPEEDVTEEEALVIFESTLELE